jgi:XTP/dITP diphosphohydrolase
MLQTLLMVVITLWILAAHNAMNKLLIATNNKGKVKEIQDLLKDTDIELVTPAQINLELDVVEDGETYVENATKKAIAFAKASNLVSLADDSGLEVDALSGAPGLYSARYDPSLSLPPFSAKMGGGGGGLTDKDRRSFLLQNLQDKPRPWTARFPATIAIATPEKLWSPTDLLSPKVQELAPVLQIFDGICEGEIIPEERGTGGFGYDPIFLLSDLGKTMAELSMEEKNRLSHRAKAVMKAKMILFEIFGL